MKVFLNIYKHAETENSSNYLSYIFQIDYYD